LRSAKSHQTSAREFNEKFIHHRRAVRLVYGEGRFGVEIKGLKMQPSKLPHVPKTK